VSRFHLNARVARRSLADTASFCESSVVRQQHPRQSPSSSARPAAVDLPSYGRATPSGHRAAMVGIRLFCDSSKHPLMIALANTARKSKRAPVRMTVVSQPPRAARGQAGEGRATGIEILHEPRGLVLDALASRFPKASTLRMACSRPEFSWCSPLHELDNPSTLLLGRGRLSRRIVAFLMRSPHQNHRFLLASASTSLKLSRRLHLALAPFELGVARR